MNIHDNLTLVLGPPGTGKTTRLISILEKELKSVRPERVMFASFTKKAATEAKTRVVEKLDLDKDQLKWFRTLHSIAFACMGIVREQVFDLGGCIELGQSIGEYIRPGSTTEGGTVLEGATTSPGTIMLQIDNLSRVTGKSLRNTWSSAGDDRIDWPRMKYFSESLLKYKEVNGLLDFADMISMFAEDEDVFVPKSKVVFIDEAQDLTNTQWAMCRRLCESADRVYVAGDDDQSIYTWSGADVESFLGLEAAKTIQLSKSYRLPKTIFRAGETLTEQISKRYPKKWSPRNDKGTVTYINDLDQAPLDKGEWLLLVRNRSFMKGLVDYCHSMGLPYTSPDHSPIEEEALLAIRYWESLRRGDSIKGRVAKMVYQYLKVGHGVKKGHKLLPKLEDSDIVDMSQLKIHHGLNTDKVWHEALLRIPEEDREYCLNLIRSGGTLSAPRIAINTIHSVKGGEADNVLLVPDMTQRTWRSYEDDPDSEHRVFYVGVTRARHNLYILEPSSPLYYPGIEIIHERLATK